ncbi:MAG: hypothetical protein U1E56_06105 [Bauldia sp.]
MLIYKLRAGEAKLFYVGRRTNLHDLKLPGAPTPIPPATVSVEVAGKGAVTIVDAKAPIDRLEAGEHRYVYLASQGDAASQYSVNCLEGEVTVTVDLIAPRVL